MTQWKLRRAAPRALEVLARHLEEALWVAALQATLGVSAPAFIALFDAVLAAETARKTRGTKRSGAAALLLRDVRCWASMVARYVPSFQRGTGGVNPNVPDDVISDVHQLIATVDKHEQETGTVLPFSEQMRTSLADALAAAQIEWGAAAAFDAKYSSMRADLREAAERFNADLICLRVAIEALVGRSHPDYRILRLSVGRGEKVEDVGGEGEGSNGGSEAEPDASAGE